MTLVPPHVAALQPYTPVTPRVGGPVAQLAFNENPLGPSPRVLDAVLAAWPRVHRYPDGGAVRLRRALAAKLGAATTEIFIGNGSNELIELLVRTFVGEGEEVLTSAQGFVAYRLAAQGQGRTLREVPRGDRFHFDLGALAAAASASTKIVFLTNPDNPTGTWITEDELVRFLEAVPRHVLVVVDEAYMEYAEALAFPRSLRLRRAYPNLVVLRTFSKIYGLAALRVGYGIARPDLAAYIDRVRAPFNVGLLAQEAAVAALADDDHVSRSRGLVISERRRLAGALAALGGFVAPSQANFVLVEFPGYAAGDVHPQLLRAGVWIQPLSGYGFPEALRITIGQPSENDACLEALRRIL